MSSTAKNNLTSDDICKIIKACAENGVYKIKCSTLEVEFGQPKKNDPENNTELIPVLTQAEHDKMNKDALEEEEIKTRDEQVRMMLIEDPLRAEEMIANGDFDEDGTDGTSEELG